MSDSCLALSLSDFVAKPSEVKVSIRLALCENKV